MTNTHGLLKQILALRLERIAEIEDSVAFITSREQERLLIRAAAAASAAAFAVIWDNPDDDIYNEQLISQILVFDPGRGREGRGH